MYKKGIMAQATLAKYWVAYYKKKGKGDYAEPLVNKCNQELKKVSMGVL